MFFEDIFAQMMELVDMQDFMFGVLFLKREMQNSVNSVNPLKWEYRAKPWCEEGVETRHGIPKSKDMVKVQSRPQTINGNESYSGTKILWPVMTVWVQVPSSVQIYPCSVTANTPGFGPGNLGSSPGEGFLTVL